jgi:AAA15 family ATPase/GTPase
MIEDIEITNFRCFDRLKVSGCKRINLISGKNNVGKTALLEAIFLNSTPIKDTIFLLCDLRRESSKFSEVLPEKMWGNFFFQQEIRSSCSIETIFDDVSSKIVTLNIGHEQHISDSLDLAPNPVNLWLCANIDNIDRYNMIITSRKHHATYIAQDTNKTLSPNTNPKYIQNSSFIPSSVISSNVSLTGEFDKARLSEKEDEVLSAFKIIDSSIIAVESFSIPEPTIYLKRQGGKRLPLSLFGDAMNRIADIILKVINNQDSVLLIDEIENGIHHSSQIALWDFLYRLAEQLNVQVFATTHSLEMTEAFIKAGLERQDSAAHFELTRHEKTNQIVAINRDLETLEYGISHHKEVRGGA